MNVRADYARKFTSETDYLDEWGTTRRITGEALAAAVDYPVPDITRQKELTLPAGRRAAAVCLPGEGAAAASKERGPSS